MGALCGVVLCLGACGPAPAEPSPAGTITFGVFGDGPYYVWENGPYRRLLADVEETGPDFFLHVGDILWEPCSEEEYRERKSQLDALPIPVIYTPGDNEWADCHRPRPGAYEPLGRLDVLRSVFFDTPGRTLGADPLAVESQARDSLFADFPENARWQVGRVVFATLHMVGSTNALDEFEGFSQEHVQASERRTAAAIAWMDGAFRVAEDSGAAGVVLVFHANVGLDPEEDSREGYEAFVDRLEEHVSGFSGQVVVVHGDSHEQRVDQPLRDPSGTPYANLIRIESFGSPQIGWLRVAMDTTTAEVVSVEPRLLRGW